MLLSADANGPDLGRMGPRIAQGLANGCCRGVTPRVGMLLLRSRRQTGDEVVSTSGTAQDLAVLGIDNQHLRRLRSAINADDQCFHAGKVTEEYWPISGCPSLFSYRVRLEVAVS